MSSGVYSLYDYSGSGMRSSSGTLWEMNGCSTARKPNLIEHM